MGCLVYIFKLGINSKSFPWPVACVHGAYRSHKIVYDVNPTAIDEAKDGVRGRGLVTSSGNGRYPFNKITAKSVIDLQKHCG